MKRAGVDHRTAQLGHETRRGAHEAGLGGRLGEHVEAGRTAPPPRRSARAGRPRPPARRSPPGARPPGRASGSAGRGRRTRRRAPRARAGHARRPRRRGRAGSGRCALGRAECLRQADLRGRRALSPPSTSPAFAALAGPVTSVSGTTCRGSARSRRRECRAQVPGSDGRQGSRQSGGERTVRCGCLERLGEARRRQHHGGLLELPAAVRAHDPAGYPSRSPSSRSTRSSSRSSPERPGLAPWPSWLGSASGAERRQGEQVLLGRLGEEGREVAELEHGRGAHELAGVPGCEPQPAGHLLETQLAAVLVGAGRGEDAARDRGAGRCSAPARAAGAGRARPARPGRLQVGIENGALRADRAVRREAVVAAEGGHLGKI